MFYSHSFFYFWFLHSPSASSDLNKRIISIADYRHLSLLVSYALFIPPPEKDLSTWSWSCESNERILSHLTFSVSFLFFSVPGLMVIKIPDPWLKVRAVRVMAKGSSPPLVAWHPCHRIRWISNDNFVNQSFLSPLTLILPVGPVPDFRLFDVL